MENNNKNNNTKIKTLKDALEENSIRIPIIQRDYVQGLGFDPFKSKRDKFLEYLLDGNGNKTLDFIYGYIENGYFVPIDGQQRLTTLFLLHLFLEDEKKDGKEDKKIKKENFTYELRTSAKDFFKELIKLKFSEIEQKPSEHIKNQSWFHTHWLNDTTVVAVLDMLDAIFEKVKDKNEDELKKLKDKIEGINFHFYHLDNFTDPEQLFIKLNARGLLLTPFEQFKAWLIKKVEELSIDIKIKDWQTKLDTVWYEMFWNIARRINKDSEELAELTDRIFLRFINEFLLFLAVSKQNDDNSNNKKTEVDFQFFTNKDVNFILSKYEKVIEQNPQQIIKELIGIIDAFSQLATSLDNDKYEIDTHLQDIYLFEGGEKTSFEFKNLFQQMVGFTYYQRIVFISIVYWHYKNVYESKNILENIKSYLRVIRNLVSNTSDFSNRLENIYKTIGKLSDCNGETEFYECVEKENLSGFDGAQIKEEIRKAKLIEEKNTDWEQILLQAENHWYLGGQVGWLLDYANENKNEFEKYWIAFDKLFDEEKIYGDNKEETEYERNIVKLVLFESPRLSWYKGITYCLGDFNLDLESKNYSWRNIFTNREENTEESKSQNKEKCIFKRVLDYIKDRTEDIEKIIEDLIKEKLKENKELGWRANVQNFEMDGNYERQQHQFYVITNTNYNNPGNANVYLKRDKLGYVKADFFTLYIYEKLKAAEEELKKQYPSLEFGYYSSRSDWCAVVNFNTPDKLALDIRLKKNESDKYYFEYRLFTRSDNVMPKEEWKEIFIKNEKNAYVKENYGFVYKKFLSPENIHNWGKEGCEVAENIICKIIKCLNKINCK